MATSAVEDTYHVTLIKPPGMAGFAMRSLPERVPHGQSAAGVPPLPGVQPEKLGAETLAGA